MPDFQKTHRLRLHVLASGSSGNAAIVEDMATGAGIAIDCGICKRDYLQRCDEVGFDPRAITAVLVTHEHIDHTRGLGVLMRGLAKLGTTPALYAQPCVRMASREISELARAHDLRALELEQPLQLGEVRMTPFPTSHDAAGSCGFRFEAAGDAVGFMTDTGLVTGPAHELLRGCRVLALEANHDPEMLRVGPYPWPVKQRIASIRGHLSNEQAACELERLAWEGLEEVVAMHVSRNNNTYELPVRCLEEALTRVGCPAQVSCARHDSPLSRG